MSEHECHCHDHEHNHEPSSIEQAGGCAVGISGTITGFNADAEARFAKALLQIGQWVTDQSGCLLGHIKAALVLDDGRGITLNLTDMDNGVEHHGTLEPCEKVRFDFMCAVLDVDEHELKHRMYHAVDDTGLDYELDEEVECHCHDHDHEHDHECGCGCGHHHDHEHEREHDGECHCAECEAQKKSEEKSGKKSFFSRFRRNKE